MPCPWYIAAMSIATASTGTKDRPCRVAVIGAGIGGASLSFYLQQFGANASLPRCEITAFERNDYIGGRLKHVTGFGDTSVVELGGAAWTVSNRYMPELVQAVGLNHTARTLHRTPPHAPTQSLGIWSGDGFVNLAPAIERGLAGDARIAAAEAEFLGAIEASYARQQPPHAPFTSIDEFLSWGALHRFTSTSIHSFFTARGVPDMLIEGGMVPLTRAIYNRNSTANVFAFLASATAELSHHAVRGGNSRLVQALFKAANAEVLLNRTVSEVELLSDNSTFHVHSTTTVGPGPGLGVRSGPATTTTQFDAVVIAAPLERTGIRVTGGKLPPTAGLDRGFTGWHVTLVEADRLNLSQFRDRAGVPVPIPAEVDPEECVVFTMANGSTNPATPYVCVQPLGKHGTGNPKGVWMLYSDTSPLEVLGDYFVNPRAHIHQHWPYTFGGLLPLTSPATQTQPVVLHDHGLGLYNPNSLESLATAMELSAMGARNVARLITARRVAAARS